VAAEAGARQNHGMRRFFAHWVITGLALLVADRLIAGIHLRTTGALIIGALVLGLVNALVRPVLVILTLPLTILTLGLFYLVVNGLAFALAAALVPGFEVVSFGSAILGALVVSVVSWAIGAVGPRAEPRGRKRR
jgi:putative membrane protein